MPGYCDYCDAYIFASGTITVAALAEDSSRNNNDKNGI